MAGKEGVHSPFNQDIIVTSGGSRTTRNPYTGLIDAIAQIQQYAVMEEDRDIPDNFLTIKGKLSFLNVGMTGGFFEGLLFAGASALIIPVLADPYLREVVGGVIPMLGSKLFLQFLNCTPIIIMVVICCYLSQFRIGMITKKAVDALLAGRMVSLMIKGVIIFTVFIVISRNTTEDSAWRVAKMVTLNNFDRAASVYRVLMNMKPYLLNAAWEVLAIFCIATIIPFASVWLVTLYRKAQQRRNEHFWSS